MIVSNLADLGAPMQIAYVPADFEGAIDYWTRRMGVGPFFVRKNVVLEQAVYRGTPSAIDIDMAISYWGDIQIEIVRPNGDAPSIFSEWRARGGEGLHHIGVMVEDMAQVRARIADAGVKIIQDIIMPDGAGEAVYVDAGGGVGAITEFVWLTPERREAFAIIKAITADWDGRDPVRSR